METTVERMPTWKMVVYTMGQFGWSLMAALAGLLTYFYIPPDTGEAAFPVLISREAILGFTVVGISGFLAQWVGLFFDPLIAAMSDRSKSRLGRRRTYMLLGALPTALLCYLIFHPPMAEASRLNAYWVIGAVVLFNILISVYRTPLGALVPEMGHTSKDRMFLCTMHSVMWILGYAIGAMAIFAIKDKLQTSFDMTPLVAFRTIALSFSALAFITMILPCFVVDEQRYCAGHVSNEPPLKALIEAFKNRDFFIITISQTIYFMADMLLQLGLIYYITVLIGLKESMVAVLGGAMVGLSICWYYFVNKVAERVSKKRIVNFGFSLQAVIFMMLCVSGLVPLIPPMVWAWLIIILMSVVAAILGIVPGAVTADVVRADGVRTGVHKEATFGAAMAVFMKIPMSLPPLIFPPMILLGRSTENPIGVRLTTVVAFILMLAAIAVWNMYDERRTLETLAQEDGAA